MSITYLPLVSNCGYMSLVFTCFLASFCLLFTAYLKLLSAYRLHFSALAVCFVVLGLAACLYFSTALLTE